MTIQNILVVLISYIIGSLLPAELVSWVVKRKPCSEIGSGNPGFANITSSIGIFAGLIVLAGDIGKTYLGMRIAYDFTRGDTVLLTSLLSLCALVTGHNFPLWNLFRGGKGVTVTCTGIILITPTLGIPAVLIGFVIVLLTGWLPLGALTIPTSYLLMCIFLLPEAVPYAIFLTAMMLIRHLPGLIGIFSGKCPRTSPFEIFKKTNRMVDEPEYEEPEYEPEEEYPANEEEDVTSEEPASDEDDFVSAWLAANEGEEIPEGTDETADSTAKTGEGEEASDQPLSEEGSAEEPAETAEENTGESAEESITGSSANILAKIIAENTAENNAAENPADIETEGPAIWSIPTTDAGDKTDDSAEAVPEKAGDSSESPEEPDNEESSSSAALWKTGILPSLEEIRRHRRRSMQEVPEARAATSPYQARRHAHRSASAREETLDDGVIFYNTGDETKETPAPSDSKENEA